MAKSNPMKMNEDTPLTESVSGQTTRQSADPKPTPGPAKVSTIGRVRWVNELNQALGEGLANSQWMAALEDDLMGSGKHICLDIWPFIRELPDNIRSVQVKLPPSLEPARLFLSNLADEERHYQGLYLKQCELAGLSSGALLTIDQVASEATLALVEAMSLSCVEGDVVEGVQAIVAAQLAAAHYTRAAKGPFERYFVQNADQYAPGRIDEGLAWLRLHAKTNTRHALWMNRMLVGLDQEGESPELPPTVKQILYRIFALWQVDAATLELWLPGTKPPEHQSGCQAKLELKRT